MVILIAALVIVSSICISKKFLERRELKNTIAALNHEILLLKRNNLKIQAKLIIKNHVKPQIALSTRIDNKKIRYLGA